MQTNPSFYITHHQYTDTQHNTISHLLTQYKIDNRRLSPLTQYALAGLAPLLDSTPTEHLFLAAPSGSPSRQHKAMDSLFSQQLPNILNFTAAMHNATLFSCTQMAQIKGNSIFTAISSPNFLQPLWLAINTLLIHPNDNAWVGWLYEHENSTTTQNEGSLWIRISPSHHSKSHAKINIVPSQTHDTAYIHQPLINNILFLSQTFTTSYPTLLPHAGGSTYQQLLVTPIQS